MYRSPLKANEESFEFHGGMMVDSNSGLEIPEFFSCSGVSCEDAMELMEKPKVKAQYIPHLRLQWGPLECCRLKTKAKRPITDA